MLKRVEVLVTYTVPGVRIGLVQSKLVIGCVYHVKRERYFEHVIKAEKKRDR